MVTRKLNEIMNSIYIEIPDESMITEKDTPMNPLLYNENENQENLESSIAINIDSEDIKPINFSDIKLQFADLLQIVKSKDAEEAYLQYCSDNVFVSYKYQQVNGFYPFLYRFSRYDMIKFQNELFKYNDVPTYSYIKSCEKDNTVTTVDSMTIAFADDLILMIDGLYEGLLFYNPAYEKDKDSLLYTILGLIKTVKQSKTPKNKIYVVYRGMHGFEKRGFNIDKRTIDIEENYNEGFDKISDQIIAGLNTDKSNLVILSGEPGTGKTSYVRYLATKLNKDIIFISPDMVDSITDPAFIPFLMDNSDSVLIIEDAEPALEKRVTGGRSSAVSNVLNLTDGLLSDCLKISIVATFNTKEKNIDAALTRKGRLLMNYKFEKLSVDKSQRILNKLGHITEVKEPMTLAEIYYYDSDNNISVTSAVGFRSLSTNTENKSIGFKSL